MDKIKSRAMFYAMGLVLVLVAIFTFAIVQDKHDVLEEKTLAHRQLLKNSFDLAMADTYMGLNVLAYQLAGDRAIVDAFAARDREALYRFSRPYFEEAKKRGDADLTGFIGADGIHFLRIQDPAKYGDNIVKKRPILAHAIATRKPIISLDVTIYDVAVVCIIPVFKDNTFIGIIQTVAKINRVQKRLDTNSGVKSAIVFDTARLKHVLPDSKAIDYHGYSLVSSNDRLFEKLPQNFTFQKSDQYAIDGQDYIIASRPLKNYQNETIAMMTCAFDITDDVQYYREEIRNLLFISALLFSGMGLVLHYGFQALIGRINRDAEVTKALNHKLEHQLYIDHLTSLPNRQALIRDIHSERFYALMLLNIDNFKEINDFYGHAMGDKTLLKLATSISEIIRNYPMKLYKMPSDEFAIVLTEPLSHSKLDQARTSMINQLEENHYDLDGASIYISLTVGMDISDNSRAHSRIALLVNADMALKSAKKRHISYLLYDETMQIKQEYQQNILWNKKVKEAIEENRFTLHYQPVVDQQDGSIIEYEALIRMIDHDGSIISPAYFLPAAKKSRLYPLISRFVIDEVFKMLETTPHTYAINLSVDDIIDPHTREYLMKKLSYSIHSERLVFELLESEGIENYQEVSSFISEVKRFGSKIAIDDFGTGYSNFAHIIRLDVDILKIDGSLIRNVDTDPNAQTILHAVAAFSKHLGFKTVAEFVHNETVYEKCRELGVDYLQGYYISPPKPLA
ncbi:MULTISPECIES: bifunctional diguanylate cyclase/phosphodiesterase [unclassified Sulfuricurvum]|uniref:bifunctional diguanylate cyclase/phosphodiesterase n=1 Tax=unclassified Sulfuricurvum TaxID=2632390 RepID=UPI000B2AEE04|nr:MULTISPECIES: EAL domain-containing protein [unclassified Sulfuricurvum]